MTVRVKGSAGFYQGPPGTIVSQLLEAHKRNGIPMDEVRIWSFLNAIWQDRDPSRAITPTGNPTTVKPPEVDPEGHIYITPDIYGPVLWSSLNLFGMKALFSKESWDTTVDAITDILDPKKSEATGCSECYEEWAKIRLDSDPKKVDNEHQAAYWVWNAHNKVNKVLNKPQMHFHKAVIRHNWAFRVEGDKATPA